MDVLAYSLLLVLGGWLCHAWFGGRWRWVPGRPKLNQDARHYWLRTGGRTLAFTTEALEVAERRAYHLTNPRQRYARWLSWSLTITLLVIVMLLGGCAPRESVNPPPSSARAPAEFNAVINAWLAVAPGNTWSVVKPTGSMLPLFGSNAVLLLEASNGKDLTVGDIAVYASGGDLVVHRVRLSSGTAIMFTGDNNDSLRPDGWITHDRIRYRVAGILYGQR